MYSKSSFGFFLDPNAISSDARYKTNEAQKEFENKARRGPQLSWDVRSRAFAISQNETTNPSNTLPALSS